MLRTFVKVIKRALDGDLTCCFGSKSREYMCKGNRFRRISIRVRVPGYDVRYFVHPGAAYHIREEDHSHQSHRNSSARDQMRERRASVASLNDPSGPRLIAHFSWRLAPGTLLLAPLLRRGRGRLRFGQQRQWWWPRDLVCHRGSTAAWTMLGEHGNGNRLDDLPRFGPSVFPSTYSRPFSGATSVLSNFYKK
ncbi:hypothetical protein MTO96_027652 [Rhipicephalus appendiculatus]